MARRGCGVKGEGITSNMVAYTHDHAPYKRAAHMRDAPRNNSHALIGRGIGNHEGGALARALMRGGGGKPRGALVLAIALLRGLGRVARRAARALPGSARACACSWRTVHAYVTAVYK